MVSKEVVCQVISEVLRPIGFKHKGSNWFRVTDWCAQVVNLQRSFYGPKFYVNLGVMIRELEDVTEPKEYQCHVRVRLEGLGERKSIERALDLEDSSLNDDERTAIITQRLREWVVPFVDDTISREGLVTAANSGKYPGLRVTLDAERHLGIDINPQPGGG